MYNPGEEYSCQAAADLSAKQYYLAKTDSNNKVVLASAATDAIIGVIHDGGRAGLTNDTVAVMLINGSGTFKVIAGGTIAKDAYLTSDASGKAVATTSSGNRVFGRAVRAAVAGDIVEYYKMNEKY